jgi:hypothetical protein
MAKESRTSTSKAPNPRKPAARDGGKPEEEQGGARLKIILAVIGAVGLILAYASTGFFTKLLTPEATQAGATTTPALTGDSPSTQNEDLQGLPVGSPTSLAVNSLAATDLPGLRTGKPVSPGEKFSVISSYDPSGLTGDIGDVDVSKTGELVRFTYQTNGKGPHEWEYKYKEGRLNEVPAEFAGVIFLDPPNNFGTSASGGFDLREVSGTIRWEARSLAGEASVNFYIGGVEWMWDEEQMDRVSVPYPDTLPRLSLGSRVISGEWQTFEYDISIYPEVYFRCVIGAFGWSIAWGAQHPPVYDIEVRNVTYDP